MSKVSLYYGIIISFAFELGAAW